MTTVKIVKANPQLAELIRHSVDERELILLTTEGEAKAVLLGLDAFEKLIGMSNYARQELMPLDKFQEQFQEALKEAGYDSQEKIVNLVQEVKREMAAERQAQSSLTKTIDKNQDCS